MISRGRGVDSRNTLRTRRERSGAGFHRDLGARGEELGPAAELRVGGKCGPEKLTYTNALVFFAVSSLRPKRLNGFTPNGARLD